MTSWRKSVFPGAMAITLLASPAFGTHFRSGQFTWTAGTGNTIEFQLVDAFRRDGYACRDAITLAVKACSAGGWLPRGGRRDRGIRGLHAIQRW